MTTRLRRLAPLLWLLGLLSLPGAAYLAGVRQDLFENRAPVGRPPLSATALGDPATFSGLDAFVRDRLPFREDALDARGRIELLGFGYAGAQEVVVGEDRWLFYLAEARTCAEGAPATDVVAAVRVLLGAAAVSGREATFVPAASKSLVERERLDPDDVPESLRCALALEEDVLRGLRADPRVPDVTGELRALAARGVPTFRRWDTHWTTAGTEVVARAILDALEPGLSTRIGLARRPGLTRVYSADLARFVRIDAREREEIVAPDPSASGPRADDALLVGDSQLAQTLFEKQGAPPRTIAEQAIPGAVTCTWPEALDGRCDARFAAARRIVVETVLRNLDQVDRGCARALAAWMPAVRGRTVRWAGDVDAEIVVGPDGAAGELRAEDPRDDVARDRVLLVPVEGGPPGGRTLLQPSAGPDGRPAPCLTADVRADGETAIVPVPAGRPLADVALTPAGPAGTRIGAPRVVTLPDPRAR